MFVSKTSADPYDVLVWPVFCYARQTGRKRWHGQILIEHVLGQVEMGKCEAI